MAKRNRAGRLATGLAGLVLALPLDGCEPIIDRDCRAPQLQNIAESMNDPEKWRYINEVIRPLEEEAYEKVKPHVEERIGEEYELGDFVSDKLSYNVSLERMGEDAYSIEEFAEALRQDKEAVIQDFLRRTGYLNEDEIEAYKRMKPVLEEESGMSYEFDDFRRNVQTYGEVLSDLNQEEFVRESFIDSLNRGEEAVIQDFLRKRNGCLDKETREWQEELLRRNGYK
ncbi:hypothetical protein GF386_06010 [Candidatus Pacearchaeota archaeon]|nr:hypothetical protein [Candidatus Pacearchaeota archaeon]